MSVLIHLSVASFMIVVRTPNIVFSKESIPSYFFYQRPDYPRDCQEVRDSCNTQISSGLYVIKPDGYQKPFEVYCDNDADSGGWTVIQRRTDGSVIFQRDFLEYKDGFGFLSQEFWLGNEKLSFLTNQNIYELRIDFTFSDDSSFFAVYTLFRISDEFRGYTLAHLGSFFGTANFTTCSNNKGYMTCTCEKSCGNPDLCLVTCTEEETCVCPDGFYLNEKDDCVPKEECGCFLNGNIIPEGGTFVASDCSRRCNCSAGQLVCDEDIACSSNAVCEERDGLRQCYCNSGYTGDGVTCTSDRSTPTDCLDVFNNGNTESGVYNIKPTTWSGSPFEVYCNMTDGGGWTVFQRRVDGSVDFHVDWDDYKLGFGSPDHELWLGNETIFSLTSQKRYQLRVDLVNRYGAPYYAKFDFFRINNEANNYRLTVERYTGGDAGDSLTGYHNNEDFSTRDEDNDDISAFNAAYYSYGGTYYSLGGWWYGDFCNYCDICVLNGDYDTGLIYWSTLPGDFNDDIYIKYTEMKVRPV
ncbi:Fibrinogen-like protein A [Holothuria leucospilota]|uniref:Fibrinogen-like protein A n=1 Tax=Holothuria leucospilota TaxID=206669 RepID=A0A9Q1H5I5_HOLLE|nr:Fibrinogen-like protein A [Holothuria leucospilota]